MPAAPEGFGGLGRRERVSAFAAVALVQVGLGLALLSGLRVSVPRPDEVVERLIEITLPKLPPPPPPVVRIEPRPHASHRHESAAPRAAPVPPGGSPGPVPAHASPSVRPVVAIHPTAPPSGGGTGGGPALGSGPGGGPGGNGYGDAGEGGTDLEQIAGAILPSDYPRRLRDAGIGGRVEFVFTVGVDGRVTRCAITRSSGVPELDALTCQLVQQRFRYRPSTDRFGRPIPDQVEGEHEWISNRR
jgi:protein TonB